MYTDQSCMTFEGAQFQGKQPIIDKLTSLPFKQVNHQITTVDSQPIIGVDDNQVSANFFFLIIPFFNQACCVMVTGQLKTDDDPPHSFHQSFVLRPAGGSFVVANDIFRLALHN